MSEVILHIFLVHVQNGHISTSGLKSDVIVVFSDCDFLLNARTSVIRKQLMKMYRLIYVCMDLQDPGPKIGGFSFRCKIGGCIVRY